MSKHLERDLKSLDNEILSLSSMVEQMIERACRALRETRVDLAREVVTAEYEINDREVHIEEQCLKILALHQPVAVDLRRVATVLKINNDLERIADMAVNIAERAQSLVLHPEFEIPKLLEQMASVATSMVHSSLDAYVNLDVELARDVCRRDDEVDQYNREVIELLHSVMKERADQVEAALHFFSAARHVERIADHATNIAEDVIYLVDGDIARHKHEDLSTAPK